MGGGCGDRIQDMGFGWGLLGKGWGGDGGGKRLQYRGVGVMG